MTIWRMRIACWKPKATNTHSQYVILIGFPLQQLLHERISVLRYTYVHHPTCYFFTVIIVHAINSRERKQESWRRDTGFAE